MLSIYLFISKLPLFYFFSPFKHCHIYLLTLFIYFKATLLYRILGFMNYIKDVFKFLTRSFNYNPYTHHVEFMLMHYQYKRVHVIKMLNFFLLLKTL